jgi:hypothetical protein
MNPRGFIYWRTFFAVLLVFFVSVFSSTVYAVENSITVTQEVNSSGGSGGGGSPSPSPTPTPLPTPAPTPEPTPEPEPPIEEPSPTPEPEPEPVIEEPIPDEEIPPVEEVAPDETAGVGDLNGDNIEDVVLLNEELGTVSVVLSNEDGTFADPVDYPVGQDPNIITSSDLNGDGTIDIVVSNAGSDSISVLINNGDGTFADAVDYTVGQDPNIIASGDLNGDGTIDIVVSNAGSDSISVLLNNGDGTFAEAVDYPVGVNPDTIVVEDVNFDNILDISINISALSDTATLINNGDGTFTLGEALDDNTVGTGDLNSDGIADVVLLNQELGIVSVVLNNGDGTFAEAVDYPVGVNPNSLNIVSDINNDSFVDILVTNADSNTVSVLLNNGDGTFAYAVEYPVGVNPSTIIVGDLNGDGMVDMVVSNTGSNSISVLLNNGDGTFAEAVDYPVDASPISRVVVEDVNNDNMLDISINRGVSLNTTILLNNGDGTFSLAGALEEFLLFTEDIFESIVDNVSEISSVVIENTGEIVRSPAGKVVTAITQPIGVVSGGVAIGSQILISTTTVTSFSDIYLLIVRGIGLLLGLFRKKRKPWGTVYDSVTKRPLDPAYVTITKDGVEVSDAITDLDGRFGFFVPPGKYTLTAGKTNYAFPSKNLAGKEKDELYESLYQGNEVENKEGEVIMKNIPLDPVTFDWNEFEKNKQNLFRLYSEKERKWKVGFDYVYKVGFFGALLAAIFNGNYLNYAFVGFYGLINIYQTFFIAKRMAVSLKYAGSNEPIPYSIVKLFSAEAGNQVKSVVSDQLGRFYLLVGPGKYYMTVDAKLPDASYKTIYKSEIMDLKDGIVPKDIIVNQ